MRPMMSHARLAVILALPAVAFPATPSFQNHTQSNSSVFGGGAPQFLHADLNGDGHEDLIFDYHPEMGDQDTFAIQLSNGSGGYLAAVSYKLPPNGQYVNSITLGDFTSDGAIDIVAIGADDIFVYANNGKGAFTLKSTTAFGNAGTQNYATGVAGDFNHNNVADLAFVVNGQLNVWFGSGNGTFSIGPRMGVLGTDPQLGDFDGDGKPDLLLKDNVNYNIAYVLYGDNRGNFPVTKTLTRGSSPSNFANFTVGDVNSDGRSDVLVVQPSVYTNRVFVYYGNTTRTFANTTTVPVGRCITGSASVADLDGNGFNDLIVEEQDCNNTYYGPTYVDVRTRNANATYNPDQTIYHSQSINGVTYGMPNPPEVLRADLNTKPDLLIQQCADDRCDGYKITTLINTTSGAFPSCNAPAASRGINVCSPTTSVASPVPFSIGASGTVPMRDVEVWVDGSKRALQIDGFSNYTFLKKSVTLNPGTHNVTVFAAGWDQSLVKKTFTLSVK